MGERCDTTWRGRRFATGLTYKDRQTLTLRASSSINFHVFGLWKQPQATMQTQGGHVSSTQAGRRGNKPDLLVTTNPTYVHYVYRTLIEISASSLRLISLLMSGFDTEHSAVLQTDIHAECCVPQTIHPFLFSSVSQELPSPADLHVQRSSSVHTTLHNLR